MKTLLTALLCLVIYETSGQTTYTFHNSTDNVVVLNAVAGDNYPQLQAAINWCQARPWLRIHLNAGTYKIYKPLLSINIVNGQYKQSHINIEGVTNAKDADNSFLTIIAPTFTNTFALGIQQGKGSSIKNILFSGQFIFPNSLNNLQIDTLTFAQWTDGICSDNRTSPYAGIVIDPFSDSADYDNVIHKRYHGLESYYLGGMSRAGSTAINIEGCGITNFVVGLMITPSFQQNGELINFIDSRSDFNKVSYAFSQAQSKTNSVFDMMEWGGVYCVFDGGNYGFTRSDGAICPLIDLVNIAGSTHQLLYVGAYSFMISIKRVYAESLFKIGFASGSTSIHFDDWQVDFQLSQGNLPSPDFYVFGSGIYWTNCTLRIYDGVSNTGRIILDNADNVFQGGSIGTYPITYNPSNDYASIGSNAYSMHIPPIFNNTHVYYTGQILNGVIKDIDSLISNSMLIRIDKTTYTGYIISNAYFAIGDCLLTTKNFEDEMTGYKSTNYPVGVVSAISGDTVRLINIGYGLQDSSFISINKNVIPN